MTQAGEKKGSGLWGSIKGAFVEEVPDASGGAPDQEAHAAPDARALAAPVPAAVRAPAAVDQAVRQKLEAAIAEQAPPGYVEFQDTLSTLADSIPDEAARWRAALKLAAKHGHSVEALLGDFDKCLGILEQKDRQFDDDVQTQLKKKVGGRQASIEQLDTTIKSKQEQIQRMQAEIAQLSEQRGTEAAAMAADERKITSVKEGFDAAYQQVHAQLTDCRAKLASFGKAVPA